MGKTPSEKWGHWVIWVLNNSSSVGESLQRRVRLSHCLSPPCAIVFTALIVHYPNGLSVLPWGHLALWHHFLVCFTRDHLVLWHCFLVSQVDVLPQLDTKWGVCFVFSKQISQRGMVDTHGYEPQLRLTIHRVQLVGIIPSLVIQI